MGISMFNIRNFQSDLDGEGEGSEQNDADQNEVQTK